MKHNFPLCIEGTDIVLLQAEREVLPYDGKLAR